MPKEPTTGADMRSTIRGDYKWGDVAKERGGPMKGLKEMMLCLDHKTGAYTRIVYFTPGFKIPAAWKHEFWEEVYVLDGYMIDYGTNTLYSKGDYALRQAGVLHGPFGSELGCTLLETTWFDRDWYGKNKK